MKPTFAFAAITLLLVLTAAGGAPRTMAAAAEQTLTGDISDVTCGASHIKMSQGLFTPAECVIACTEKAKFVLVSGENVVAIANQDFAGLKERAAQTVKVTGEVRKNDEGKDEIVIAKMEPSK